MTFHRIFYPVIREFSIQPETKHYGPPTLLLRPRYYTLKLQMFERYLWNVEVWLLMMHIKWIYFFYTWLFCKLNLKQPIFHCRASMVTSIRKTVMKTIQTCEWSQGLFIFACHHADNHDILVADSISGRTLASGTRRDYSGLKPLADRWKSLDDRRQERHPKDRRLGGRRRRQNRAWITGFTQSDAPCRRELTRTEQRQRDKEWENEREGRNFFKAGMGLIEVY